MKSQNLVEISKYVSKECNNIDKPNQPIFIAWYCVVFRQHTAVSCKSVELQNPIHFNLKVYEFDGGQQSSRAAGGVSLCFCQTGARAVGAGRGQGVISPHPTVFSRSFNPIQTRGQILSTTLYTIYPIGFPDLPTVLGACHHQWPNSLVSAGRE